MARNQGIAYLQGRLNEYGATLETDGKWGTLTKAALDTQLPRLTPSSAMALSFPGVLAIAGHEAFVPGPYRDAATPPVWTAYFGHTAAAGPPDPEEMPRGMPEDLETALREGGQLLASDLLDYTREVLEAIKVPVAQHELDAAVSFHYNTGGIGRATWVKSLNKGDRKRAAEEIMNWTKNPEVVKRREAEQTLFRDAIYPESKVTVWGVSPTGKVIWKPIRVVSAVEMKEIMSA